MNQQETEPATQTLDGKQPKHLLDIWSWWRRKAPRADFSPFRVRAGVDVAQKLIEMQFRAVFGRGIASDLVLHPFGACSVAEDVVDDSPALSQHCLAGNDCDIRGP